MNTTQVKTRDLEILKLTHAQRKINTVVKNSHELAEMLLDGDVKNVQIHDNSISFEIDYEKRFRTLSTISVILVIAFVFLLGLYIGRGINLT